MLTIQIQGSRKQIGVRAAPQILYLLAEINLPEQLPIQRLPLNICLVIDRSTSMKGERLERVKGAAVALLEKLAPEDTVSLVTFSDRAEVVVPASPVRNKVQHIARVQGIQASGGTEIYQGLVAAMRELGKVHFSQYLNHIILLTDGHTYGDATHCLRFSEEVAGRGVGISAFGIGVEWNDQFLDQLVLPSGGRSDFIESPEQVLTLLQERIQGLGSVYAHNLRLQPDLPDGVRLNDAFKVAPFAQPLSVLSDEIQLGAIEGRSPTAILLELIIAPQPNETLLPLRFNCVADIPSQHQRNYRFGETYRIAVEMEHVEVEPPVTLVAAVRILNLYRMHERVHDEVEAGQAHVAQQRMQRLTQRLNEAGFTKLAEQAQSETRRLTSMGTVSLEGHKKLKYGTRSMLTKSLTLKTVSLDSE